MRLLLRRRETVHRNRTRGTAGAAATDSAQAHGPRKGSGALWGAICTQRHMPMGALGGGACRPVLVGVIAAGSCGTPAPAGRAPACCGAVWPCPPWRVRAFGKHQAPGSDMVRIDFMSLDSDRPRPCRVRIRIGFGGPGSDSDRFRRVRLESGSDLDRILHHEAGFGSVLERPPAIGVPSGPAAARVWWRGSGRGAHAWPHRRRSCIPGQHLARGTPGTQDFARS